MSEVRKIAHNTITQIIGKVFIVFISLAAFGLITRYLGQEVFGYYTTIYAFLMIIGILLDLGLQMTTTKLISNPAENESKILSNAITLRLISYLLFLILVLITVIFLPYPKIIKIGITIAALGFVFNSINSVMMSFFQKHLMMYKTTIAEVIPKIIFLISIIFIIYFNLGLLAIIGAVILDNLLNVSILVYFVKKQIPLKISFDFEIWKKILKTTWPIALTIALNLVYFKGDIFIMSLVRSQNEVGLYGAPYKILEVLINIAYIVLGLILPLLVAAIAMKNFDRLKTILQAAFDFLIILTIPMIVGGYFLGRKMMVLISGPEFLISGDLIKILLLATGIVFIAGLFGYAVVALDKQKNMIKFYALNAIISTAGYIIFIPKYSYWGAAWITVFSEIFILIPSIYLVKKSINFFPNLQSLIKSIAASMIMAVPLYFFYNLPFFILLLISIVIYFSVLYLINGFDKKIILEIVKIRNK